MQPPLSYLSEIALTPFRRTLRSRRPPTPPTFRRDGATEALLQLPRRHEAPGCTCAPPPRELYRFCARTCIASSALPPFSASLLLDAAPRYSYGHSTHASPGARSFLSDSLPILEAPPIRKFRIHYRRCGMMRVADGRLTRHPGLPVTYPFFTTPSGFNKKCLVFLPLLRYVAFPKTNGTWRLRFGRLARLLFHPL